MIITIKEAHDWAFSLLKDNNVENASMEAEVFIRYVYGWDRNNYFMNIKEIITTSEFEELKKLINRRISCEPLQYITGVQEFYGRDFLVNSNVLIPRSETELLIENLLIEVKKLWGNQSITAVDIGTGSGAIALTLALEKPNWDVHTIDISEKALETARENAERLSADVSFHLGDLLKPIIENDILVDIIISNPPYIPTSDVLELMPEVKGHEPKLALDGGEDGLDFYRQIILQSKSILKNPGIIAFEVGINQADEIKELLINSGAKNVMIKQDFQGIDRFVFGFLN